MDDLIPSTHRYQSQLLAQETERDLRRNPREFPAPPSPERYPPGFRETAGALSPLQVLKSQQGADEQYATDHPGQTQAHRHVNR